MVTQLPKQMMVILYPHLVSKSFLLQYWFFSHWQYMVAMISIWDDIVNRFFVTCIYGIYGTGHYCHCKSVFFFCEILTVVLLKYFFNLVTVSQKIPFCTHNMLKQSQYHVCCWANSPELTLFMKLQLLN